MVLMAGVAVWSFGTLVAPMAAHSGFMLLCLSRVLVRMSKTHAIQHVQYESDLNLMNLEES